MELNEIQDFLDRQKWIFAKTYANKAPHEYCLLRQVNGEVPEGYCVVLIDRRGTPTMAKYGWWDIDNPIIKKTAIQWCNLHCVLKNK